MLSTAMDALRLLEFLLHLLQQNVLVFYLLRIALEQEVQKEWHKGKAQAPVDGAANNGHETGL